MYLREDIVEKARQWRFERISDDVVSWRLGELFHEMVLFVGERYGQKFGGRRYRLSDEDNLECGGCTLAGWASSENAIFFNRTRYYDWLPYSPHLPKLQDYEVIDIFAHETGHVVRPEGVQRAADIGEGSFNHSERFADYFSKEFRLWIAKRETTNLTGYETGLIIR
mgnify:CR=1 FL=1